MPRLKSRVRIPFPAPLKNMGQVKYLALIFCRFTPFLPIQQIACQNPFLINLVKSVPYLCLNRALKIFPCLQLTREMTTTCCAQYCNNPHYSLIAVRNKVEGLKVRIRRALIGIGSPVWGFLPRRSAFCLTTKEPNPEIFRFSPFSRVSFMMLNADSTISCERLREHDVKPAL